jgi:hypothetical protein
MLSEKGSGGGVVITFFGLLSITSLWRLISLNKKIAALKKKKNVHSVTVHSSLDLEREDVIPVEKRVASAFPSNYGLYPHELLALNLATTYYTDKNKFQKFWWYEHGVKDVQSLLISLQKRGFLQGGGLFETLSRETVTTLKVILKDQGLKQTGKKEDLLQRILGDVDYDVLCKLFPRRVYTLTEQGKNALEDGKYIASGFVDIWTMNRLMHENPGRSCRDIIWMHFGDENRKHIADGNFGLYRNTLYNMSLFLRQENRLEGSERKSVV